MGNYFVLERGGETRNVAGVKLFYVHLNDGKEVPVNAEGYVHDNGQYTFQTADGKEVQFFKEEYVVGIQEYQGGITVLPRKRKELL